MPDAADVETAKVELDAKIDIRWETDDDADLSMLGTYSNEPKEGAIDRCDRGDRASGEYRYWNPGNHAEFNPKNWEHVSGQEKRDVIKQHGSLANAERHYREADYQRHEAYNRGEWCMEGCVVTVRLGGLSAKASLWGIESDCGPKYRQETEATVTQDALAELRKKILARLEVE